MLQDIGQCKEESLDKGREKEVLSFWKILLLSNPNNDRGRSTCAWNAELLSLVNGSRSSDAIEKLGISSATYYRQVRTIKQIIRGEEKDV